MSSLFHPFTVMKLTEENSAQEGDHDFDETEDGAAELEAQLELLQEELSVLEEELMLLESNEPDDVMSNSYDRWEERHTMVENHISDVQVEIEELEEQLE